MLGVKEGKEEEIMVLHASILGVLIVKAKEALKDTQ